MKVLVKTKEEITLVTTSGEFIDNNRFRVVTYDNEVRRWESKMLLEIKAQLKDIATDNELSIVYAKEGIECYKPFVEKYDHAASEVTEDVKEEKATEEGLQEVTVTEETTVEEASVQKSYKPKR